MVAPDVLDEAAAVALHLGRARCACDLFYVGVAVSACKLERSGVVSKVNMPQLFWVALAVLHVAQSFLDPESQCLNTRAFHREAARQDLPCRLLKDLRFLICIVHSTW